MKIRVEINVIDGKFCMPLHCTSTGATECKFLQKQTTEYWCTIFIKILKHEKDNAYEQSVVSKCTECLEREFR